MILGGFGEGGNMERVPGGKGLGRLGFCSLVGWGNLEEELEAGRTL